MDEPLTALGKVLLIGLGASSMATLLGLFFCRATGITLLPSEPRRPVPWGPEAAGCLIGFVAFSVVLSLLGTGEEAAQLTDQEFIHQSWSSALVLIGLALCGTAALAPLYGATPRDLGLPTNLRQAARDVATGILGCLASLLPVYGLLLALRYATQPEHTHPIIEQLQNGMSGPMLGAAAVSTVVAAPIFEEFAFRLVLQGWLEKWFTAPPDAISTEDDTEQPEEQTLSSWPAIFISSILFGLAHYSHGAAPVPLMLFGIVLGYMYQRTHRILPCIAAHALFNGISLVLLWAQLPEA